MNKRLSIIVPIFNERNTLETIIKKLVKLKLYNNIKKEIIIIDDCSTDGSVNIIKKYTKKYNFIRSIYKKKNNCKCRSGFIYWQYD